MKVCWIVITGYIKKLETGLGKGVAEVPFFFLYPNLEQKWSSARPFFLAYWFGYLS